jgi:hypothetical protein
MHVWKLQITWIKYIWPLLCYNLMFFLYALFRLKAFYSSLLLSFSLSSFYSPLCFCDWWWLMLSDGLCWNVSIISFHVLMRMCDEVGRGEYMVWWPEVCMLATCRMWDYCWSVGKYYWLYRIVIEWVECLVIQFEQEQEREQWQRASIIDCGGDGKT